MSTASNQARTSHEDLPEKEVLFTINGRAGVITLNRPKALNTLNLSMIQEISQTLKKWAFDDRVAFVVVEGNGEKAFCAGGDIRSVYQARLEENLTEEEQAGLSERQGGRDYMDAIFREEYQMNYYISQFPKPYISLIHGLCMGGGMGLSILGSHRIVTDNTIMSMPETAIGFVTDVGSSYFLNLLPGKVGLMMGLTGERLGVGDCLYTGLATHYVPAEQWPHLRQSLLTATSAEEAKSVIEHVSLVGIPSELSLMQDEIDALFSASTLKGVLDNLESSKFPKAYEWLKATDTKSPTSMQVIFTLLHKGQRYGVKKCLAMEFRLSQRFVRDYDFFEGIRSVLVDKDNKPQWQPARLQDVKITHMKEYFSPLKDRAELELKELDE